MRPLNLMRPFVGLRVERSDGVVLVGCRDDEGTTAEVLSLFVPGLVLPETLSTADVVQQTQVPLPVAPECTYSVTYNKTGGVSSAGTENDAFHRRHVVAGESTDERAPLLVVNPDAAALASFLNAYEDVRRDAEEQRDAEGNVFVTVTTSGELVPHTIFAAAWRYGLECVSLVRRQPTILCDTLFRSKHTFAQHTKTKPMHEVGPTREHEKYCMEHVPPAWLNGRLAPFTWEAYARHVFRTTPGHRLAELPEPLRSISLWEGLKALDEVLQSSGASAASLHAEAASALRRSVAVRRDAERLSNVARWRHGRISCDPVRWAWEATLLGAELSGAEREASEAALVAREAAERCDRLAWRTKEAALARAYVAAMQPVDPVRLRCPPLTEAQQEQCIHLFHCLKYGADLMGADTVAAGRAALFQYALRNGTVPRIVTVYEKTNRFVGFGDELRQVPADERQMPAAVRNRCRVRNGKLVGGGGQGSKGIVYSPKKGRKAYKPTRQHKRKLDDNQKMETKRLQ